MTNNGKYIMNKQEKELLQYLLDENTKGVGDCELGYQYFLDLCDNYDITPTKEFVDTLQDYGIYIEQVLNCVGDDDYIDDKTDDSDDIDIDGIYERAVGK